ncbi:unnamed protein product [Calicophoron daubneyi]|uniref:GPN-loop GTPase n=1 Tax=Calicophoron daubneyi TaxID=300641 RepID=A0AAV2TUQ8_CALDB
MTEPSGQSTKGGRPKKPVCIIVLGMAGSGKTTFAQKLLGYLNSIEKAVYAINLDPAVHHVPYPTNIDIRDTVKFKEIMKQYGFGPNGAIMTSLNFFASQFNKVIDLVNKSADRISYVVLDTPGQIEVFTWSASGTIISETLSSSFPTVIVYVMDTPRSHNPVTFMSNMLYACSVLYRMRLPFLIVLNKTDIIDCAFAIEWMRDFEAFQDALASHRSLDGPTEFEAEGSSCEPGASPYMNSLINSMSLVLDEFYSDLRCCGVSSVTGEGMEKFMQVLDSAVDEYYETYFPLLLSKRNQACKSQKVDSSSESPCSCSSKKKTDLQAPEPLGASGLKGQKVSRHQSMLVDLAGDNDNAEDDALVDLDGTEERESEEDDEDEDNEIHSIDNKFRKLCTTVPRQSLGGSKR